MQPTSDNPQRPIVYILLLSPFCVIVNILKHFTKGHKRNFKYVYCFRFLIFFIYCGLGTTYSYNYLLFNLACFSYYILIFIEYVNIDLKRKQ